MCIRDSIDTEAGSDALLRGIAARMHEHFDLIEGELSSRSSDEAILVTNIYFAALVRWAQLYPLNDPITSDLDRWPAIEEMCHRIETDPAARRAFDAEFIPSDQAITLPCLPDLPLDSVTGV